MKVFFFTLALIPVSRGVCTPKKWMSIFTFIDGFPPSKLIVFCRSPPGTCAVSTKKTRWLVSLWGTGFPFSRVSFPHWPQWSFFPFNFCQRTEPLPHYYVPLIEHSDFILGILTLPSALSRLFWQPTLGGFLSIHFALHPTPMWESDLHTSISSPPKQVSKASGKLEGIELALKVSNIRCYLFVCLSFRESFCQAV